MQRRGHLEEKHENTERWLLTYSDLITLLLVFFVVMYSVSKADEAKFAKLNASLQKAFNVIVLQGQDTTAISGQNGPDGGNKIMDDFLGIRTSVMKAAEQMGIQSHVNVTMQQDGIAISLSGNLLFDSGRADLRPESTALLEKVGEQVRAVPNEIRIEGHTDSIPVDSDLYPTNWELSAARATAVTRFLVEVSGIDPRRLSAQGYSQYRPLTDNSTRENRALNRRVDIVIVYPKPTPEPATNTGDAPASTSGAPAAGH
ncbi:MAG: OmpA family protein [Chloroflexi bacterium]|nr:OmpA family protein [Chloroflexota bacterium]